MVLGGFSTNVGFCKTPVNIQWYSDKIAPYQPILREYCVLLKSITFLNHPKKPKCFSLTIHITHITINAFRSRQTLKISSSRRKRYNLFLLHPWRHIALTINLDSYKVFFVLKIYWFDQNLYCSKSISSLQDSSRPSNALIGTFTLKGLPFL